MAAMDPMRLIEIRRHAPTKKGEAGQGVLEKFAAREGKGRAAARPNIGPSRTSD
jgi:hypothetical protein